MLFIAFILLASYIISESLIFKRGCESGLHILPKFFLLYSVFKPRSEFSGSRLSFLVYQYFFLDSKKISKDLRCDRS